MGYFDLAESELNTASVLTDLAIKDNFQFVLSRDEGRLFGSKQSTICTHTSAHLGML